MIIFHVCDPTTVHMHTHDFKKLSQVCINVTQFVAEVRFSPFLHFSEFLSSLSLVQCLLLVLSIIQIYSRFTRPPGKFDLPQTDVYCAYHLSTVTGMVNILSLTVLQHSGTHFQKKLDSLSQCLA